MEKTMKIWVVMVLSVMLMSCGLQRSKPLIGPNGGAAYYIDCTEKQEDCSMQARELCQNGHNITKIKSSPGLSLADGTISIKTKYNMLIECKP
jgi:hypothetical protein